MKTFAAAILAAGAVADVSNHWAVIMAGSNTYWNYRHQADSHHAVKLLMNQGIPRDQIIHLAYDDVAYNSMNPFQGQLFNVPITDDVSEATLYEANVYDADYVDYTGAETNKSNFFKVLLGDTSASGPVLKSDENSRVFVYFVDHGGAGLICTPQSSSDWIYADELDATLLLMKDRGMFKELVFYLEACESGSMFPNLSENENIYALTASNATQSSYAAYCGSQAVIDQVNLNTCLADLFSINWMLDTEAADVASETLSTQQANVKAKTTMSPVQHFGDTSFLSEPIGDFQSTLEPSSDDFFMNMIHKANDIYKKVAAPAQGHVEVRDSRDHKLHALTSWAASEGTEEAYYELQKEIDHRQFVDALFKHVIDEDVPNVSDTPQNFDCLRLLVGGVEEMCGSWSDYSLKHVRKLANVCDSMSHDEVAEVYTKIGDFCGAF